MARLAEKIVDAVMTRLSMEFDILDTDEYEERRQELLVVIEKVLIEDQHGQGDADAPDHL